MKVHKMSFYDVLYAKIGMFDLKLGVTPLIRLDIFHHSGALALLTYVFDTIRQLIRLSNDVLSSFFRKLMSKRKQYKKWQ